VCTINKKITEKIPEIKKIFDSIYNAKCTLNYQEPYQLLIATQLAAQCTDARVNIVMKDLIRKYKSLEDFAAADLEEFQNDIRSTGFFRNKAKNIIAACKMIISDFGGRVPDNMTDLLKLPGVGRKTANLILGTYTASLQLSWIPMQKDLPAESA
jgi:endonuclease-3